MSVFYKYDTSDYFSMSWKWMCSISMRPLTTSQWAENKCVLISMIPLATSQWAENKCVL